MSESLLPPLILELRSRAGELLADLTKVRSEVAKTATETEASAKRTEVAASKTAEGWVTASDASNRALTQVAATSGASADKVAEKWNAASASMRASVLSASASVESATARTAAAQDAAASAATKVAASEKVLADAIAAEGAASEKAITAEAALTGAKKELAAANSRLVAAQAEQEAAQQRQIAANSKLLTSTEASSAGWQKFDKAGKAAAIGVAAAAGVIGVESLKMAGNFQAQINRLETAAGESKGNLQKVADGIMQVARDTGTSTTELANGMYQIESAGFHGADGLKVLQAAAEGAKNEGADMGGVANALTTVMTDLGAKSGESANLMSQMVAAVGQGKMKMDDLAGSIHSVLPNAAALGLSFPQVAGALATMTAEGVSADQAAQNLNHTIVKLAAPTAAMSNAMAGYGVNATDLKNNLGKNGLTGTMDILSNAILSHMGPAGLALQDTFNKSKQAGADVQKMLHNLPSSMQASAKGFLDGSVSAKEFTLAIKGQGAAGAAQGAQFMALAKTANGFNDALKSGKSDAQTFSQAMYSMLGDQTGLQVALHLTGDHMGAFKTNVDVIGKATAQADGHVKDWSVTQGNFNTQMGRFKETIQTAAITIEEKLLPVATKVIGFLADHKGVVIAFASVIGGVLVVAATAWAVSMASAAAATIAATWPILAIIAAVAVVGVAIYEFATHWHQIWGAIKDAAAAVWNWIKDAAGSFANAVFTPIEAGLHLIESVWHTVWGGITAAFDAVTGFISDHSATIVGVIAIIAFPISLIIAAIHFLWTHWQQIWGAITDFTSWAYNSVIKPIGEWIVGNVLHPIGTAISWLGGVWSSIWSAIGSAASWVYGNVIAPIGSAIGAVFSGIHSALSWLADAWSSLWNGIGSALSWVYNHTIGPIVNMISGAISGVMSAVHGISNAATSIGHMLGFDNGGVVPGPKGAPRLAVVHGGEYVLSNDMLAGRQEPTGLPDAQSANGWTAAAPGRAQPAGPSPSGPSGVGGGPTVNVYAQTNADPRRIAAETGWALRAMA